MSITVEGLEHVYLPGTPLEKKALHDVNLEIPTGSFCAIVGPTGSGKSTLVQHLNGLLRPSSGHIYLDGVDITARGIDLRRVRQRVGLVFQFPEQQLFEETVWDDIAFGPRNLGLPAEEIAQRVAMAMALVGLDQGLASRSPFGLSGGEMRRVALAGVLAMSPEVLVLDEPAAGLDPRGRDEIIARVATWHRELGITVVVVSHTLEDVAPFATQVVLVAQGTVHYTGPVRKLLANGELMRQWGLDVPPLVELMESLRARGLPVRPAVLDVQETVTEILRAIGGGPS